MIKNAHLHWGIRFLLYIASFLLGLLLFVAVLATSLIASFRVILDKNTIHNTVREVVVDILSAPTQVQAKAPIAPGNGGLRVAPHPGRTLAMVRRDSVSSITDDIGSKLSDIFYEILIEELGDDVEITNDEFKEFVNQSTAKDYIADKAAGLVTDYFMDDVDTSFDTDELLDLIDENRQLLEEITGEPLLDDLNDRITRVVEESEVIRTLDKDGLAGLMEMNAEDIPGMDSVDDQAFDFQNILQIVRTYTSLGFLILGIVLCLALMFAIVMVNIHQFSKGLRRAGYPLLMVGMGILPCLLADIIIGALDGLPGARAITKLISRITPVYGIILGVGVAMIVASIVFAIILRNREGIAITKKYSASAKAIDAAAPVSAVEVSAPVEAFAAPMAETCDDVPESCCEASAEEESPIADETPAETDLFTEEETVTAVE